MSDNLTIQLNNSIMENDQSEMDGKYLTFFLDNQRYAFPLSDVVQIIQVQPITSIPEFPSYAKGIINQRGNIIPVIDVRLRLGKEECAYNDHTCIIIIMIQDLYTGLIVDSVDEVLSISDDEISPPPKLTMGETNNAFLSGIGKQSAKVILLMDTQKLLAQEELSVVQGI